MNGTEPAPEHQRNWTLMFVGITALIVALSLFIGIAVPNVVWDEQTNRGAWGDMYGGVAALFSGIALAGVVVAILMQQHGLKLQRQDLDLQREELRLTREELAGQKDALRSQVETLNRQRFEQTLFEMLRLRPTLVEHARLNDAARRMGMSRAVKAAGQRDLGEWAAAFFEHEARPQTRKLLQHVLIMFELIQTSSYEGDREHLDDVGFYTRLVKAQLFDPEFRLLLYYCIRRAVTDRDLVVAYEAELHLDASRFLDTAEAEMYGEYFMARIGPHLP